MSAVALERELLLRLIELHGRAPDVGRVLEALVAATGASAAHVEMEGEDEDMAPFACTRPRGAVVSRGIVRTVGTVGAEGSDGGVIECASARFEALFGELASVREQAIEAVLAAPIEGWRIRGVLYLHRAGRAGAFGEGERALFALVRRELGVAADRIVHGMSLREEARRLRERLVAAQLARTGWNVTHAAKALGVTRTYVYEVMRSAGFERPLEHVS